MKQSTLALSILLATAGVSWADEPTALPALKPAAENEATVAAPSAEPQAAHPADDVSAIRAAAEAYVQAYNNHDAAALAQCWADDAVYLTRDTGESIEGREAIAAMFQEMFNEGEADRLSVAVHSVRLITPEVAIEDGSAELTTAEGQPLPSTYTAVHVKKDGKWYLTSVRETDVPAPATEDEHPAELQQLAWMVGNWVDQDETSAIRTTCDWSKNGKFLTSNFEVDVDGAVTLAGTQVIGWDPVTQSIRSWMFDSEGGFGEGVWHRDGDQWAVESKSTQADGSQATATNVYRVLDEGTFGWRSANRQVDGEPQPDIEEVSVYRQ
jgi:uncharacterized protein (TIGR02246 family)